jgi:spore coat protein SA
LRAKYGLGAADGPVLVYVGVLKRRKGVHLLPDVLDRVRRRFAGAALLVVGSGWHGGDRPPDDFGREVERAAGRVGPAIRFTGFAPPEAVPDILAAADIVIAPAQWEDVFPRVNIEALAVGVPLVTSPRGGIPEAAVDGRTALLVRAYASAEGHAEAVCRLLDDPALAERLARNGRRLVERRYTWERTANDFRMLYAALLAGRSGTTDARCGRWTAAPARSS